SHARRFRFQADDGIRDRHVTGVQTCALPIFSHGSSGGELLMGPTLAVMGGRLKDSMGVSWSFMELASIFSCRLHLARRFWNQTRSGERRVGIASGGPGSAAREGEEALRHEVE